jgi:hypothetical protein
MIGELPRLEGAPNMRFPNLLIACLAWVTLTVSASPQEKAPRFGLVIANSSYAEADSSLTAGTTDARQLADEFRRNNFEIDLKENVGASDMRRAINTLITKLRSGATALLYFSGYGVQIDGQTYLIPVNAQITSEADVRDEGINLDATLAEMHRRGAQVKIVVIDAARRNPYEGRFRTYAAGLSAISGPEGMLAIYSAALGKLVPLAPGAPSLFMRELLKELRLPLRSFEDSLKAAREAVDRATNHEQTPWMATTLFDSFYLVPETPAAGTATTKATTTTTTSSSSTTPTRVPAVTTAPSTQSHTSTATAPSTTTTNAPITTSSPAEPANRATRTTAAERCREAMARAQIDDLTDEDRAQLRECRANALSDEPDKSTRRSRGLR